MQAADPHTIPILVSASSLSLRKRFYKKEDGSVGKEDYCNAKHFSVFHRTVSNIQELSMLLSDLEGVSNNGIIRGALKDGVEPKETLRRLVNFSDMPRYFMCVDVDELPCPDFCDPLIEPAETIIDYIIGHLPPEFHDASYHYQFSSSFGTEGLIGNGTFGQTLKAHIWFMLDQPRTCEELHRWAQVVNDAAGFKLVDVSLYNPVQMHYVSRPHFDGLIDPVKERSGFVERENDVVRLDIPLVQPSSVPESTGQKLPTGDVTPGFDNYLERIGGEDGFNLAIYKAIWSYLATCRTKGVNGDEEELKQRLRERIASADKGSRSQANIDRYMSDEYLDDQIRRAYEKFLLQTQAQTARNLPPTYPDKAKPLAETRKDTQDFVAEFMLQTRSSWEVEKQAYEQACDEWRSAKREAEENGEVFTAPEPILPMPPIDVLAPDVGVGKTFAAISQIARYIYRKRYLDKEPFQPIVILAPTIELAEELKSEASRHGIKNVGIMRGRLQSNPEGTSKKMCMDPKRIKAIESFSGNARDHACGTGAVGYSCPLYAQCEYQKQRKALQSKDVVIMAHNYLFGPPPIKNFKPEFIVIDEDITKSAIPEGNFRNAAQDERDIRLDALTKKRLVPDTKGRSGRENTEFLMDCSYRLHRALQDCPEKELMREALERHDLTARDCKSAMHLERLRIKEPEDVFPKLDTDTLVKRAKKTENTRPYYILTSMWGLLADFLDDLDQTICATVRRVGEKTLRILKKREIHECYQVPMLLLDATFSPEVFRSIFYEPNRYLAAEAKKPHQYVRQIIDTNVATSSFTEDKKPAPIAYDVYNHIQTSSRLFAGKGHGSYDVLVVLPLQVEFLFCAEEFFPPLPDNVALAHFNALRGKNAWEGVANLIVVSRSLPQVCDIEEKAEAARQVAIARLEPNEDGHYFFRRMDKALRLVDGCGQIVSGQWYHPDTVAEGLRWAIQEAELIQAIGRARGVNRTEENPLVVDIITNTALPVTVHETMPLSRLVPDRFDFMAMNGAIPSNGKDQCMAYSGLYDTPKAAERAWERLKGNNPHLTVESYIIAKWGELISRGANPPVTHKVQYRNDGARGPAKTFIYNAVLHPSPLDWLQKHVSSDIILASIPEPLPWEVVQLPWDKNRTSPALITDRSAHLLPMPDLDRIERKPRCKDKEPTFTLEEIGHAFGKSKTDIEALLKEYQNDERAVAHQLLRDAVPVEGRAAYGRLPEIVQQKLDHTLLDGLST